MAKKPGQGDPWESALRDLRGGVPAPRTALTEAEKDEVVARLGGPRTLRALLKAQAELPAARIPFLFSALDTQAVVDALANDMTAALARAEARRKP